MAQQVFVCIGRKRPRPAAAIFGRQPLIAPAPSPSPPTPPLQATSVIPQIILLLQARDLRLCRAAHAPLGIFSGQVCIAAATAQENRRTCSCHLKGCRVVAACGGNQRLAPCRSTAGEVACDLKQAATLAAVHLLRHCASSGSASRRGMFTTAQRQARPRRQPRPGTRALQSPQPWQVTTWRRRQMPNAEASRISKAQQQSIKHHRPRDLQ
jgi:hypothetical protein